MFNNFHLATTREMKELKTGHGCSALYAFYIRILSITGHTRSLKDSYYRNPCCVHHTAYIHVQRP